MEQQVRKKTYRKRRKRKKKPSGWTAGACLLAAVMVLTSLLLYKHYTQMVQVSGDGIQWTDASRWTVLDRNGYSETVTACEMDGELYISAEYINTDYAEEALFFDKAQDRIYYTTASKKTVYTPDSSTVYVQGEEYVYDRVFSTYEDEWLVKLEWASELFGIEYTVNAERQVVLLLPDTRDVATVSARRKVYLKKSAESGSMLEAITGNTEGYSYYRILEDGEQVICIGTEGEYTRVLTTDGYMGYVLTSQLGDPEKQYTVEPDKEIIELPESRRIDGNVVLAWHQDYSGRFTETTAALFSETAGIVNVVSPTWFKFTDSGKLQSCANSEYVKWAHGEGYQVWALIDNDFADEKTYAVLQDEAKRTGLIAEVLAACESLGLDGINVDFEGLSQETAPYFVEFMRELCAVLRPAGYCVSVDVSVPEEWSSYYRRDLLAQCCDYVIIMGYDEHYRGGGATGSVSSLPWVSEAVAEMLSQASADKIILGVPFYTQLWSTAADGTISSAALSMEEAYAWIAENQAEVSYDEDAGQEYVTVTQDGTVYEIWLENAMSMKKRMALAEENQLAGVACWKMGMESADIWEVIERR